MRRAGWGFTAYRASGEMVASALGAVHGWGQLAMHAEVMAVITALRLSVPPITVVADSQTIVRGADTLFAARRDFRDPAAFHWGELARAVQDYGPELIAWKWIPGRDASSGSTSTPGRTTA